MSTNCNNLNPLLRDGTSQQQRTLQALLPAYIPVDEHSLDDLRKFAQKFAEEIKFYELNTVVPPLGPPPSLQDWTPFFDQLLKTDEKNQPHYTLFIAFLEMFRVAQTDLNQMTQRHLDFFYRDVLRLQEKAAVPDQVFTIFKLASEVSEQLVPQTTELDAKKDGDGIDLVYETDRNIVVNPIQVEQLKAVYIKRDISNDIVGPLRMYASEMANSMDGKGREIENADKRWKTFGRPVKDSQTNAVMQTPGEIGFALASPVLAMAEGDRSVTIDIKFLGSVDFNTILFLSTSPYNSDLPSRIKLAIRNAIELNFSGEEEWIQPTSIGEVFFSTDRTTLTIHATVSEGQKTIVGYNAEVLKQNFKTALPLVKCTLKTSASFSDYFVSQQILEQITIASIKINTVVTGIRNLILQNDEGSLNAEKPFQPFGSSPRVGSSFYIGSNELFTKRLDTLSLNIEWFGVPTSFVSHYRYYEPKPLDENGKPRLYYRNSSDFEALIQFLDQRKWKDAKTNQLFKNSHWDNINATSLTSLMSSNGAELVSSGIPIELALAADGKGFYSVSPKPGAFSFAEPISNLTNASSTLPLNDAVLRQRISINNFGSAQFDLSGDVNEEYTPLTRRGFMRFVLNSFDFGHNDFPTAYTRRAFEVTKSGYAEDKTMPRDPYTPVMRSLSLEYSSSDTITLNGTVPASESGLSNFFHVSPFGTVNRKLTVNKKWPLLPRFTEEGNLYIGLSGVKAPQTLSLLLKVADGTANPDYLPQPISWSYLAGDEWVPFEDLKILSNTTNGLLDSGIVIFDLPRAFKNDNTSMPEGLFWLRASIANFNDSVCEMIAVHAQAVTATFDNRENDTDHLRTALAASTIKDFVISNSGIEKVEQPYSSFGGKISESKEAFYTRVSERLRHKNRAITIWDYEHIVLEEFPQVFKIKCLNHTRMQPLDYSERAPGHVSLVVIPDVRNKNAIDPLRPKTSLLLLQQIDQLIKKINPPCAELHVRNPYFEEVQADFEVKFLPGFDNGFYAKQLDEDLRKFLSPWAYDGTDLFFGGRLHKTVILDYVEDLPYVDYVTCFRINQYVPVEALRAADADRVNFPVLGYEKLSDLDEAVATTSASILTSYAKHIIRVQEEEICECPDNDVIQPYLPPTFNDPDCGDDPNKTARP
ncbi:MAG: baseplate J/gp47 family protein, partial [Bacteroidia bacterium]